jgi:replicative DNA helicase
LNLVELKIKLRRLVREQKIRLVIIDYLQLLIETKRFDSRQEEASYISRQLKTLARELKVPIICLSQLSRNVERRDSKRPIMSDLRESGAIEQDSDLIIFLFREDYYNQFIDRSLFAGVIDASVTELIVSKHRNGPIGVVETPFKIN